MIYVDDNTIKVGGVVLPGLYKSLEIKTEAKVEEQEVEGSTAKPKQATGYEDAKITLEIVLEDGPGNTKEDKLEQIQTLFRRSGQTEPEVHQIVNEHTSKRGVTSVIFKSLSTKETNKKEEIAVSIEFWEYVPMTITATKGRAATASSPVSEETTRQPSDGWSKYLGSRGTAPKISNKLSTSPAVDNEQFRTLGQMILGGLQ